jgi:hypothetical protein
VTIFPRSSPSADPACDIAPIGERMFVYSALGLTIFLIAFAAWTALSLPGLIDPRGKPVGYDFMAFWSAARLALEGRPEAVFDWEAIEAIHRSAVPGLAGILFPWYYPPTFLLAVLPLGLVSYPVALAGFLLTTVGLWAALVRRITADPRAWVVIAAMPAALFNLLDGQNGFLTTGLAGFALLLLDKRPWFAGVLIGSLAIKPHLAVLFPLALMASGRWRSFGAAALTVAFIVAASLMAFGWDTAAAFLAYLPRMRAIADNGWVPWGLMPSAYVFALSLGVPTWGAATLQAAVLCFAALCVWRAWRCPTAPFEARAAVLLSASLMVSPYLFSYDLMWAGLAVIWLSRLAGRSGFLPWEWVILLAAWIAPLLMAPLHWLAHVQIGVPVLLLLLVLAIRRTNGTAGREPAVAAIGPASVLK